MGVRGTPMQLSRAATMEPFRASLFSIVTETPLQPLSREDTLESDASSRSYYVSAATPRSSYVSAKSNLVMSTRSSIRTSGESKRKTARKMSAALSLRPVQKSVDTLVETPDLVRESFADWAKAFVNESCEQLWEI